MPVLSAENLQKAFGARAVLDGVTLTIRSGERVGLVGTNGSGKSTLARVLAGLEPADGGTIARRRGAEIAYLEQDPVLDPERTARELVVAALAAWSEAKRRYDEATAELASGGADVEAALARQTEAAADVERLGGWDRMHQVEAILGHLGVERPDDPVRALSGGERRRVALARILVAPPSLAILDEPTNHLDVETIEWLEQHLHAEYAGALLLVTHDRYLLDRIATRTLELDGGKLRSYDGGYEDYLAAKAERLEHEARVEANRRNFLRRELEWLRRQPKARTTKQKARIERAEAAQAVAAPKQERTAKLELGEARSGKTILELRGVRIELGGRTLVGALDWVLTQGERVGVVGRNGTGKTSLLRAIVGELAPAKGEVAVGQNTRFAYFDQQRSDLDPDESIFDNVAGDRTRIEVGGRPIEPRTYLEEYFLFDGQKQRQPVGSLSGGERARVALAKMLRTPANVVLLDEPTNDLDVATLGALEQMLVEFGGTAIVVTHDRWFLDRIATSILAFEGDGRVVRYAGNYETYRRLKAEDAERQKAEGADRPKESRPEPPRTATDARDARPAKKGLTFAEKKELDALPDRIDAAERDIASMEARLADPAAYAGGEDIRALVAKLDAARAELDRLMSRWEALESKRSA